MTQILRILAALREAPGTHHDVAARLGLNRTGVASQLSYLVRIGRANVIGEQSVNGHPNRIYRAKGAA